MKNNLSILIALILLPLVSNAEEIRDPFAPFSWDKQSSGAKEAKNVTSKSDLNATPLARDPLSFYRLEGVIVSPTDSLALLRSKGKSEYFATVGDKIGNEGGVIDVISSDGITVDLNGKLIDINVSNRFDTSNESQ